MRNQDYTTSKLVLQSILVVHPSSDVVVSLAGHSKCEMQVARNMHGSSEMMKTMTEDDIARVENTTNAIVRILGDRVVP